MADKMNIPDAFERRIKDSLDQYEVPFNSSDWAELEKALDGPRNVAWWLTPGMVAAFLAGTLIVGGSTYLYINRGTSSLVAGRDAEATSGTTGGEERLLENHSRLPEGFAIDHTTQLSVPNEAAGTTAGTSATGLPASAAVPNAIPSVVDDRDRSKPAPSTETVRSADRSAMGSLTTATPKASDRGTSTASGAPMPPAKSSSPSEMTFKASVSTACPGEEITFKVENMPTDGIYLWNFGDGSFSNKANPEHTFTKPGNYQVMLSMSAAGVGTIHNKPSSDIITIHEAPKADFHALKQEFDGHIPSVHFENRSNGAQQYHWEFGDGSTSTVAHPDHVYKKKGVYPVRLTVTSERGCMDIMEKEVRIDNDYNLDAPSAFTPAQAETFMPEALRTLGVKFHLMVYSADGALMYETTDATKPWTGRSNNRGEVLPEGEYVWVVDVRERLHLAETYTGKVILKH